MFRCVECGAEFEVKPQYCDCGNDVFEEILPTVQNLQSENDKNEYSEQDVPIKISSVKSDYQHVEQAQRPSNFKIKQSQQAQTTYYSEDAPIKKTMTSQDYLSLIIFAICLILSVIVIFADFSFLTNNMEETPKISTKEEQKDIPTIDSFWKEAPISTSKQIEESKIGEQTQEKEPEIENVVEPIKNIIKILEPRKNEIATAKNFTNQSKTNSKTQIAKTVQPIAKQSAITNTSANNANSGVKTSNQSVNIDLQKILSNAKKSTKTATSSAASLPIRTSSTTSTTVSTPVKTSSTTAKIPATVTKTTSVQVQTVNKAAQRQELANYKVGLRNTIGKKIDFTKVVGDGSCTVAFKVNNSGQLVNRTFSSQSSNITLNDAVYNAVMATPGYSQPPNGYNNETMYLKVSFTNGNFNITLN